MEWFSPTLCNMAVSVFLRHFFCPKVPDSGFWPTQILVRSYLHWFYSTYGGGACLASSTFASSRAAQGTNDALGVRSPQLELEICFLVLQRLERLCLLVLERLECMRLKPPITN